jgi:hypothetical protein
MEEKPKRKPFTLLKRALFNQYNYIMMGGSALFAMATGSWLPVIVGAGAEVLWLVLGADSSLFRKWVEKQETKEEQARLRTEVAKLLSTLDRHYVERFEALRLMGEEIQSLATTHKGLESILLQDEMAKLGQVQHSFLKMAASHQRLSRYLQDNPVSDVERDIARCQRALKQETDGRVQASLKQALSLAQKRLRQHERIEGAWKALSVQMDTLEKALDYLKSHILGIGTREELSAELDSLVTGVASVSELEATTDELMGDLRTASRAKVATLTKG